MKNLQDYEKILFNELRKNARISLPTIAKMTNTPLSTIYDRVKSYEKDLIFRYASLANFQNLGYLSRALVILKVKKDSRKFIQDFLQAHPSINTLYHTNGGSDYFLEIITQNPKILHDCLDEIDSLDGVLERTRFDVIQEIKKEEFLIS